MEQQKNLGATQVAVELEPQVLEIVALKAAFKGISLDRYLGELAEREVLLMQTTHQVRLASTSFDLADIYSNNEQAHHEQEVFEILAQLNQAAAETSRRLKRVHLAMREINSELHAMHSKESVSK